MHVPCWFNRLFNLFCAQVIHVHKAWFPNGRNGRKTDVTVCLSCYGPYGTMLKPDVMIALIFRDYGNVITQVMLELLAVITTMKTKAI